MLIADGAELAAVGGVDLHPIRNNPVANADLEKRVAFVLTVALGDQPGLLGELCFAAETPSQTIFLIFPFSSVAEVGVEDHSVVNQRKTDGHVEIGVTAMCAAGLRRVADRKADAIAIGFQRREQGLQLDDRGPAFRRQA